MKKFRSDAKPIDIEEAARLYADGTSLRDLARKYGIHHTNIMARFRRFGIPVRSQIDAVKATTGKPKPSLSGEKNHQWKGGYSIDKSGYVVNNRTHVREHREIAERILGRPLKTNEVCHHYEEKTDNKKFIICTKGYHSWLHARMEDFLIGQNYRKYGGKHGSKERSCTAQSG